MKEINIKNLQINFEISQILDFINEKKEFEIDIFGTISEKNSTSKKTPLIFQGQIEPNSMLDLPQIIANGFGNNYKPQVNANSCTLIPVGAWQSIIDLNQSRMSYFDHQTDGVEVFEDKVLEEIGWHAIPFNINYRQISAYLEASCEGTFVFYDNGMHFNGFVILDDINDAKEKMTTYVVNEINNKIANGEIDTNDLDDDQEESLAFFNIKGEMWKS